MHPRKGSDIFTPTKHFNCSQLWRFQKFDSCFVELKKNPPNSLPELVNNVERYAACIESDGGTFEYKRKSFEKRY